MCTFTSKFVIKTLMQSNQYAWLGRLVRIFDNKMITPNYVSELGIMDLMPADPQVILSNVAEDYYTSFHKRVQIIVIFSCIFLLFLSIGQRTSWQRWNRTPFKSARKILRLWKIPRDDRSGNSVLALECKCNCGGKNYGKYHRKYLKTKIGKYKISKYDW